MFAVRTYNQGVQRLVAACDEELLGESYREGELRLDVAERFYDGERVDEEVLRGALGQCTIANLVGERCVAVGIEVGLVDPANVMTVEGVPHAQYMLLM